MNSSAQKSPISRQAVIALIVMAIYLLPIPSHLVPGNDLAALSGQEAIYWGLAAFLLCYVKIVERRPISSVGLAWPRWTSLGFGLAGAAVMIVGMAFIYLVVFPAIGTPQNESGMEGVKALPLWFRVLLIFRAAIFEELFFRGFMIERLTEITRLRWLAAVISVVAFTWAHLGYWGWAHLIVAGFGGIVLTVLFLWRRDLSANMIGHLATDAVGFLTG